MFLLLFVFIFREEVLPFWSPEKGHLIWISALEESSQVKIKKIATKNTPSTMEIILFLLIIPLTVTANREYPLDCLSFSLQKDELFYG